jgi:hypothetical protein
MSVSYGGDSIVFADGSVNSSGFIGHRNRIINGGMVIDQRNAGAATSSSINGYTLDRWSVAQSTTGKLIVQQNAGSVTPPAGFSKYLGVTSQSAFSVGAGDYYWIHQTIEGYNIADLNWGTASGVPCTLSFWVRSSLTGSFGGSFRNSNGSQQITFSYTINSANTWEYKTVVIPAPNTGSTWTSDNTHGVQITLGLGTGSTYGSGTAGTWSTNTSYAPTGSVSVVGTSGATFYITGVQLERGSTASSFEYRPIGVELNNCFRYFFTSLNKQGGSSASSSYQGWSGFTDSSYTHICTGFTFPVAMRAFPSITIFSGSGNGYADGYGRGQYGGGFVGVESGEILNYCANNVNARAGGGSNTFASGAIIRGGYTANAEM